MPKLFSFLRSGLRRLWMRWPARGEAIKRARIAVEGQRHRWEVPCAKCGNLFKMNEIQVDHQVQCGSLKDWDDIEPFVRNLFCAVEGLQCLCKTCHSAKTKEERKK